MRIISQGNESYNFDAIEIWQRNNVIGGRSANGTFNLGIYKTDERAKEVFEEIHISYTGAPMIFKNFDTDAENMKAIMDELHKTNGICVKDRSDISVVNEIQSIVYQMPKE